MHQPNLLATAPSQSLSLEITMPTNACKGIRVAVIIAAGPTAIEAEVAINVIGQAVFIAAVVEATRHGEHHVRQQILTNFNVVVVIGALIDRLTLIQRTSRNINQVET